MNDFITQICSIKDHPIKKEEELFRVKYLKGLGACLSKFTDNKKQIESLYKAWCFSIIGREPETYWLKDPDLKDVSRALRIQRKGFRFFTMRKAFFFDCFYLLNIVAPHRCDELYEWLRKEFCSIFTRPLLKKVYIFFKEGINEDIIPKELLEHKKLCDKYQSKRVKNVLIVANVSAGKSTLINALVGYRLNKMRATACTSRLCYIYSKPVDDGVLAHNYTLNDFSYTNNIESVTSDTADRISLKFNSTLYNEKLCLIDTPGINNIENSTHGKITEEAIKSNIYDAIIYISNCQYFGTTDERRFLEFLKKHSKRPIIFVLNQLDRFKQKEDSISKMLHNYYNDLLQIGFENPKVLPISAYSALLFKLPNHFLDEDDLYDKEMFELKFKKEYYNMQSYNTSAKKDTSLLGCSGINYLEEIISQI